MEKAFAYILECEGGSFYCGWALDAEARTLVHNEGKGAKYTQRRLPVKLIYFEEFDTRAKAAQRECQIKSLSRKDKILLIQTKHPEYQAPVFVRKVHCPNNP